MKNNKKTVLHIIYSLSDGGTERFLINLLGHTCKDYNNLILCYEQKNVWQSELEKMGVKVFVADGGNKSRMKKILEIVREYDVDIVYSSTYHNSAFVMLAAYFAGVKKRIVHSHRTEADRKLNCVKVLLTRICISILSTDCLACSDEAGKSLFLFRKFTVIRNGIEVEKYRYDLLARKHIRKKYNVNDDCILIGSIGRLDGNKNQEFMVRILKALRDEYKKDCKLMLVGEGEDREKLNDLVFRNSLSDNVIFAGGVKQARGFYSAFDVFLLTSLREGLPFVLIEAQANGVPVLSSLAVPDNIGINPNFKFLDIKLGVKKWIDEICMISKRRLTPSDGIYKYSAKEMAESVMRIYEK